MLEVSTHGTGARHLSILICDDWLLPLQSVLLGRRVIAPRSGGNYHLQHFDYCQELVNPELLIDLDAALEKLAARGRGEIDRDFTGQHLQEAIPFNHTCSNGSMPGTSRYHSFRQVQIRQSQLSVLRRHKQSIHLGHLARMITGTHKGPAGNLFETQ